MSGALAELPRTGYPSEYLLARLRGRRRGLHVKGAPDAERIPPLNETAGTARRRQQREIAWLYRQMDGRLRTLFSPILLEFELSTALLCLRLREQMPHRLDHLLADSLLAPQLQATLKSPANRSQAAAVVAAAVAPDAAAQRLVELHDREGLAAFERDLVLAWLTDALQQCRHPVLRRFLQRLVDLRNLRGLGKHLRWDIQEPPPFVAGGVIARRTLDNAWRQRTLAPLLPQAAAPVVTAIEAESALLDMVTSELARAARQPDGSGLILDYLWQLRLKAGSRRLFRYGQDLPADVVAGKTG